MEGHPFHQARKRGMAAYANQHKLEQAALLLLLPFLFLQHRRENLLPLLGATGAGQAPRRCVEDQAGGCAACLPACRPRAMLRRLHSFTPCHKSCWVPA